MSAREERLVTFEVAGSVYGIPIADVLEVAEVGRSCAVPSLPPDIAGVVNHHGDALPVVARSLLFEGAGADAPEAQHLLVLAGSGADAAPCLGLPVDRICGLVPGAGGAALDASGVVERRPIDGRVVSILDTRRLLERAVLSLERVGAGSGPVDQQGG